MGERFPMLALLRMEPSVCRLTPEDFDPAVWARQRVVLVVAAVRASLHHPSHALHPGPKSFEASFPHLWLRGGDREKTWMRRKGSGQWWEEEEVAVMQRR
ncbi:hypothetical protein OsI_35221 [Oryza sativa Indica Group]|uniref:Uncharacterized protein n=1 Tax=Oryza sativa subsp. indica TaxID=39946 RepID=B8BJ94_ORYSI|nr:hypothetical protein OsI_35221 [Oryza sativa Indica Group]